MICPPPSSGSNPTCCKSRSDRASRSLSGRFVPCPVSALRRRYHLKGLEMVRYESAMGEEKMGGKQVAVAVYR